MGVKQLQVSASVAVQSAFYNAFYNWGYFVAKRPCMVIWLAFVLCVGGSTRLFLAFAGQPLESVVEQDQLWVPQDAQAVYDKAKYDEIFSTTFRRNVLYFTAKNEGDNILTNEFLSEVRRFDLMVTERLNATAYEGKDLEASVMQEGDGRWTVYNDVCAKSDMNFGQNLSDPEDNGAPGCVIFGHPLEAFYRVGGGVPRSPLWLPGDFVFDFEDGEINDIVTSGRGPDKTLFPDSSNRTVNTEAIFGGLQYDEGGRVTKATALAFTYLLDDAPENTPFRAAVEAWEDQLNCLIGPEWTNDPPDSEGSACGPDAGLTWESDILSIYPQTEGATSRELGKMIRGDLGSLNASFFIILLYAIFIFFRFTPVHSRVLLALAGCWSVALSILFAYGFTSGLGFKLNPVINVLPFILIGIGVDDMFVLVTALENAKGEPDVKTRMAKAMGHAGVSITITSLTDLFAFVLGSMSALPALSTFCVFAAIGIGADFLLQISFFAGWMALDAYREAKNKVDCCPCCCGTEEKKMYGCCCCCGHGLSEKACPIKNGQFLHRLVVAYYIPLLRNKAFKAFVLVLFTVLTAGMGFCASNLKQDFQFRWFVSSDAKLQDAFDVQDAHFPSTGLPVSVVTPGSADYDYSPIAAQKEMVALGTAINGLSAWIEDDSLTEWYPAFREWVHSCGTSETFTEGPMEGTTCLRRECLRPCLAEIIGYGTCAEDEKTPYYPHCTHMKDLRDAGGLALEDSNGIDIPGPLEDKYLVLADGTTADDSTPIAQTFIPPAKFYMWLDQFLADDALGGALYSSEVLWINNATVRDEDAVGEGITATRMRANYRATDKADEQVASMQELRVAVDSAGVDGAFPYMFMYLYYEQYAIIVSEAIFNLSLALCAVFIIVTLLVANLTATLLVMLCVILVDIDILGLMWLWGLTIDSVAIINLVLAVGLAVDYSVHVAHCFMQTPGERQDRVDKAVEEMGVPVIHGAFSTFLAVLILSQSKSYIFVIFFKQFFGIVLFGSAHGLLLLPILLSLVGPEYVAIKGLEVDGKEGPNAKADVMGKGVGMMSTTTSPPTTTPPTEEVVPAPSAPPSAPGSENGDSPIPALGFRGHKVAPYVV